MGKLTTAVVLVAVLVLSVFGGAAAFASEEPAFQKGEMHITYNRVLTSGGALLFFLNFEEKAKEQIDTPTPGDGGTVLVASKTSEDEGEEISLTLLEALAFHYKTAGCTTAINNQTLTVTLAEYKNYTDYYIKNGINGYEPPTPDNPTKNGFYFKEYTTVQKSVFAELDATLLVAREMIKTNKQIGDGDITYAYHYGTKYRKTRVTTNAPQVVHDKNQGIYWHVFQLTDETRVTQDIVITQITPNALGWYGTILLVALAATAGGIIWYFTNKKKKATVA